MDDLTKLGGIVGSNTPIPTKLLKGWLFSQSWILKNPGEQLHPVRWTSVSKGQVWNPPPIWQNFTWKFDTGKNIVRTS